jgi:uncharacterized protein
MSTDSIQDFTGLGVRAFLHAGAQDSQDGIALTHGAGSHCDSVLLRSVAAALAGEGFTVLRYDLPFRAARPSGPPRPGDAAADREGIQAAVRALRTLVSGRVFAGGHSYGGRQTSMAAAEDAGMAGALVLLSYPLHPPRKPDQLRTAHFPQLRTPALFAHGTRDPFGSPGEMRAAIAAIPAQTDLYLLEGAGHELAKPAAAPRLIAARLAEFSRSIRP